MYEPTEIQHRKIKVKKLWIHNRETIEVQSIKEAISEVKTKEEKPPSCQKIILGAEVVYTSDKHGDIGNWECEWKKQKRIISTEKEPHDCPFNHDYCYKDSYCSKCKMKLAREGAVEH